ncbi:MAG: hypothetical protein MUE82_07090, partial [Chloroflexi bacterium]|nr:hypothetical protein [Chloroflexota bacterium]
MDERIDGAIRLELAAMLGPAAGSHPRWTGSPAATRVAAPRRTWRMDRRWTLALAAAALVVVGGAAALVAGGLLPTITLPVVPPPSASPEPTAVPTPDATAAPSEAPSPAVTPAPSTATSEVPATGPAAEIRDVAFDADGLAWLATTRGVVRWTPGASVSQAYGEAGGLPSADVARVAVGPDGGVWAAGSGWVAQLVVGAQRWTAWTEFDGQRVGDVGGLVVGPDGTAWAALTTADGTAHVARMDAAAPAAGVSPPAEAGAWTLLPAPIESYSAPWSMRIVIDGDGRVWAVTHDTSALYAWDGSEWTLMGSKADLGGDPSIAGVTPDGSVWVTMMASCLSVDGPCPDPGNGIARYDGTRWIPYGTADGLLDPDVLLDIGADGSLWATYDFLPGAISRFDGTRWTTQAATKPDGMHAVAVGPDGRLWLAGNDDLYATDGTVVRHLGLPVRPSPAPMPLTLESTGEEGSAEGPTGLVSWRVYTPPTGHFFIPVASAHGPVAIDGTVLRWSTDGGVTWEGTTLSIDPWRVTAAGDDLVAFGTGAVRLAWRDGRWIETGALTFDPPAVSVDALTFGPRGWVATAGASLYFSRDGVTFRRASREPSADGPTGGTGEPAWGASLPCAAPGGGSWPGTGSIGPVIATVEGFVAFTPADPADWNDTPYCEPLAWTSADGDAWTLATTTSPFGAGAWVAQIAGRDGRFVAVGGRDGRGAIWVSDDGLAWRLVPLEIAHGAWSVAADDAGWVVATLDDAARLRISPDG